MKLMPIVWATDMQRSTDFYRKLGGTPIPERIRDPDGLWIQIDEHARDIRRDAPPNPE